jgi:DNA-binding beta-propeller fold protein YncE
VRTAIPERSHPQAPAEYCCAQPRTGSCRRGALRRHERIAGSDGSQKKRLPGLLALALCLAAAAAPAADRLPPLPLEFVADVPLPGDTSRFDYASFDAPRHLLFIAHLGASEVLAFDTQKRVVAGRVRNLSQVHGVLAIPALGRVYASATGTDEVVAIDPETFAIVARMPGGRYPDGMAYAAEAGKLYVSDETGASETVIDIASNQRIATIALGGEVGNTQYDPLSKHIFVNVQSRAELVEIDPATDAIAARIDLPGAKGNHGLLIEAKQRLAFVACEGNDKLLIVNLATRKVTDAFDVGAGPDVLADDAGSGVVYVASESGTVDLFGVTGDRVARIGQGQLAPNAHVVAVDPDTHLVYFPLRNISGHPVLRVMRLER